MKNYKGSKRTHAQIASNPNVVSNAAMSQANSIGANCKMWFPCEETSGAVITDVVGGVEVTPSSLAFGEVANTVSAQTPLLGSVPSAGVIPSPGNKSFILFTAHRPQVTRFESKVTIGGTAAGEPQYGHADGDASFIRSSANSPQTFIVGMDTWVGGEMGIDSSIAAIRDAEGEAFSTWLQGTDPSAYLNDFYVDGDMFIGNPPEQSPTGIVPQVNGRIWGEGDTNDRNGIVIKNDYDLELVPGIHYLATPEGKSTYLGVPGVWGYVRNTYDINVQNRITLGVGGSLQPARYYGIALFVFQDGLPADFKEALRWMKVQWALGNKVIWPDWVTLA